MLLILLGVLAGLFMHAAGKQASALILCIQLLVTHKSSSASRLPLQTADADHVLKLPRRCSVGHSGANCFS